MPIHVLAGIDFNTGIRGILVVALAVAILPGSVYLLLATNTGARLGLLIALAAVCGWVAILSMTWWINSPANGPRGRNASWKAVEIYVHGSETGAARTTQLNSLPPLSKLPTAQQIIADHPEILKNYPNPTQATLSDIANNNPELLPKYMAGIDMGGWRIVPQSAAGDAGTVAGTTLTTGTNSLFKLATDYKIIGTFDYGGKPTRLEYCGAKKEVRTHYLIPGDPICRIQYKLYKLFHWNSPPHYEVVLVQKVVPQTARAGPRTAAAGGGQEPARHRRGHDPRPGPGPHAAGHHLRHRLRPVHLLRGPAALPGPHAAPEPGRGRRRAQGHRGGERKGLT